MDKLNMNSLLGRTELAERITGILMGALSAKGDLTVRKGLYISGKPGCGKTRFISDILDNAGLDMVSFDAGDIRNKSVIETLTRDNMANHNVLSMFGKKSKPLVIVMDEIDGMNSGDKGGINSLIKVVRPKKTRRQKTEEYTSNPIVCLSNFHVDKKIRELMKVCHAFSLDSPTDDQIRVIAHKAMPAVADDVISACVGFAQGDLRKLRFLISIHDTKYSMLRKDVIEGALRQKNYNEDTRDIVRNLFNHDYGFSDHASVMNETDRTIVGLLWHENVTDLLVKQPRMPSVRFYLKALEALCYADYIDRVTFQRQIWQFNEMSSLIKTFYNSWLYHNTFQTIPTYNPSDVRFTKVLTKYSTEYNNATFIQFLCQQLGVDVKDMISMFLHFRDTVTIDDLAATLDRYSITKLDIGRLYRYLDKYVEEGEVEAV